MQNENKHVYRETPEEGLVHLFRTMKEGGKTHHDIDEKEGMTSAPHKWAELLNQDYFWEFMEHVEPMEIHMFDSKTNMKRHCLHKTMLGPAGRVSTTDSVSQMFELVHPPRTHSMPTRYLHTWFHRWKTTCANVSTTCPSTRRRLMYSRSRPKT